MKGKIVFLSVDEIALIRSALADALAYEEQKREILAHDETNEMNESESRSFALDALDAKFSEKVST
jgi:hypothetical protein